MCVCVCVVLRQTSLWYLTQSAEKAVNNDGKLRLCFRIKFSVSFVTCKFFNLVEHMLADIESTSDNQTPQLCVVLVFRRSKPGTGGKINSKRKHRH